MNNVFDCATRSTLNLYYKHINNKRSNNLADLFARKLTWKYFGYTEICVRYSLFDLN